jgi:hypothetical protein
MTTHKISLAKISLALVSLSFLVACGGHEPPPQDRTISGTIIGLSFGNELTLQNNVSSETVVSSNGNFSFTTPVEYNGSYSITVALQPTEQMCTISRASGTGIVSSVVDVHVDCINTTYIVN